MRAIPETGCGEDRTLCTETGTRWDIHQERTWDTMERRRWEDMGHYGEEKVGGHGALWRGEGGIYTNGMARGTQRLLKYVGYSCASFTNDSWV